MHRVQDDLGKVRRDKLFHFKLVPAMNSPTGVAAVMLSGISHSFFYNFFSPLACKENDTVNSMQCKETLDHTDEVSHTLIM